MCKAKEYTERLIGIFNEIEQEYKNTYKELSRMDRAEQKIVHKIENINFDAATGYKFAKSIQDIRRKRRDVKNEISPLQSLKDSFVSKHTSELNKILTTIEKKDTALKLIVEKKRSIPKNKKG